METIKIKQATFDLFEYGQRLSMKKRGQFGRFCKRSKKNRIKAALKSFSTRRRAIEKGDLGKVARFGRFGCSSYH